MLEEKGAAREGCRKRRVLEEKGAGREGCWKRRVREEKGAGREGCSIRRLYLQKNALTQGNPTRTMNVPRFLTPGASLEPLINYKLSEQGFHPLELGFRFKTRSEKFRCCFLHRRNHLRCGHTHQLLLWTSATKTLF